MGRDLTLDHDPMSEARHYRDAISDLIKLIEASSPEDEAEKLNKENVLDILRYAHLQLADRYRNFVHVYAIAQKGEKKTTKRRAAK